MKKLSLTLIGIILAVIPAFAGKIVTDSLYSKVLDSTVKFNVYLPDGYSESRHYPVVYLLHGLSDTYVAWATDGGLQLVADELIVSGEAVPMVIIMPNAGDPDINNKWNGYFNMPGWHYRDFFFEELLPSAEKKYNCGGSKGQRAVMGLSMGGGGSTVYAQRQPEMFSSCYAMSAWLDNKNLEVNWGTNHGDCLLKVQKAVTDNSALDFIDNADENTLEKLRTVKWFIDCGDDDFLFDQNVELHKKMRDKKIKSELRVRDGVHNWEYWHLALRWSLPFASRNFYN